MFSDQGHANNNSTNETVVDVKQLIPPGSNHAILVFNGQRYTLRITQSNKLILTK